LGAGGRYNIIVVACRNLGGGGRHEIVVIGRLGISFFTFFNGGGVPFRDTMVDI
jgi:hypothetical protein